mmetsp:Transcript_6315/g.7238  ORF Transcript_6315/g.7238 Transcript_6315/m.7238 type:complete len:182 (-) Transcript_6315:1109-1654(-)
MGYYNYHRDALKMMLRQGAVDFEAFKQFMRNAWNDDDIPTEYEGEQGIDCLVGELNSKLQEYKMKLSIRKFRAEDTDGKLYWVLVNTVSDKVAQQATSLKDWQVRAFKRICELLSEADGGIISSTEIVSMLQQMKTGVSVGDTEEFVDILLTEKWLYEYKSGRYKAGVRASTECQHLINCN